MRFCFLVLLVIVGLSSGSVSLAADVGGGEYDGPIFKRYEIDRWKKAAHDSVSRYNFLKKSLKENPRSAGNYALGMRASYANLLEYEPFSERLVNEMTQLAYLVDTSKDSSEVNSALIRYKDLLELHLANLSVIDLAIDMARINMRLGDVEYLEMVRNSIVSSLTANRGDGLSAQSAFTIYSDGEENYLLTTFDGEVVHSELFDVNGRFYNVHDVELENGRMVHVYMDVTTPIRQMQIKRYVNRVVDAIELPPAQ